MSEPQCDSCRLEAINLCNLLLVKHPEEACNVHDLMGEVHSGRNW